MHVDSCRRDPIKLFVINQDLSLQSLCNACGIRYRKKRGPQVGPDGIITPIREGERAHYTDDSNGSGSMRVRFVVMGKRVTFQRPRPKPSPPPSPSSCLSSSSSLSSSSYPPRVVVVVKKQRCQRRKRKLRMKEEEMAAFSLMALSCGSVFA